MTIPFEETNVNRASVGESLSNPSPPSHRSPPPVLLLLRKYKTMVSVVVECFIPLTHIVLIAPPEKLRDEEKSAGGCVNSEL